MEGAHRPGQPGRRARALGAHLGALEQRGVGVPRAAGDAGRDVKLEGLRAGETRAAWGPSRPDTCMPHTRGRSAAAQLLAAQAAGVARGRAHVHRRHVGQLWAQQDEHGRRRG